MGAAPTDDWRIAHVSVNSGCNSGLKKLPSFVFPHVRLLILKADLRRYRRIVSCYYQRLKVEKIPSTQWFP